MKRKKAAPTKYELEVTTYSVRVYPGRSSLTPDNYAGKELAYLILGGKGTAFVVHVLPDGTSLPETSFNPDFNFVQMSVNLCQLQGLLKLLATADSVQAIFDESDGFADIEGQFSRKARNGKRK